MIQVYLNYPNSQVSAHLDPQCGHIRKAGKAEQRHIQLNPESLSPELLQFGSGGHAFGATTTVNDMWLSIDFSDLTFELAVLNHIHRLLAGRYQPFANAQLTVDCP